MVAVPKSPRTPPLPAIRARAALPACPYLIARTRFCYPSSPVGIWVFCPWMDGTAPSFSLEAGVLLVLWARVDQAAHLHEASLWSWGCGLIPALDDSREVEGRKNPQGLVTVSGRWGEQGLEDDSELGLLSQVPGGDGRPTENQALGLGENGQGESAKWEEGGPWRWGAREHERFGRGRRTRSRQESGEEADMRERKSGAAAARERNARAQKRGRVGTASSGLCGSLAFPSAWGWILGYGTGKYQGRSRYSSPGGFEHLPAGPGINPPEHRLIVIYLFKAFGKQHAVTSTVGFQNSYPLASLLEELGISLFLWWSISLRCEHPCPPPRLHQSELGGWGAAQLRADGSPEAPAGSVPTRHKVLLTWHSRRWPTPSFLRPQIQLQPQDPLKET